MSPLGSGLRRLTANYFEATAPYASGSVYINFMPDDENDKVEKAYGPNYRRLTESSAATTLITSSGSIRTSDQALNRFKTKQR